MRCPLLGLLLASFLGLGLTTSALRAQGCEACSRSQQQPESTNPVVQWLHSRSWYCWAHHNTLGCSSLCSELTFVFGSCREFYGEPCFKGPPPPPSAIGRPGQPIMQQVGP
jgi:hypothetical protein